MIDQSKLRFKKVKNIKIEQYINKNTKYDFDIETLKKLNKTYEDKKIERQKTRIKFTALIYFRLFLAFAGLVIFFVALGIFNIHLYWGTMGLFILGIILYWVPTIQMCDVKGAIDLIKEWRDNDILIKEIDTYPLPLKVLFDTNSVSYKGYFSNRLLKAIPLIDKSSYENNCAVYKNSNVRTPAYTPYSAHSESSSFLQSRFNITRYSSFTIPYTFYEFIYEFTKYQLQKQGIN